MTKLIKNLIILLNVLNGMVSTNQVKYDGIKQCRLNVMRYLTIYKIRFNLCSTASLFMSGFLIIGGG